MSETRVVPMSATLPQILLEQYAGRTSAGWGFGRFSGGRGAGRRPSISRTRLHTAVIAGKIPLSAARAASVLTLVYRDNDGRPNAVGDFVEALRSTSEDRASRTAPIAMRASR